MAATGASQSRALAPLWALHFWASLLVLPILSLLALTGAVYLFEGEIADALDPGARFVAPVSTPLPPSALVAAALRQQPGTVTRIETPEAADRPLRVFMTGTDGAVRAVVLDPADGRVIGAFDPASTLGAFAKRLHGSLLLGSAGRIVVELAACWTLVMLLSGALLWIGTRRAQGRRLLPDGRARGRARWRDLHAGAGLGMGLVVGFLVLTGLPWAIIEGDLVRKAVTALEIGYAGADVAPASGASQAHHGEHAGWTMQGQPIPASADPHALHRSGARSASPGEPAQLAVIDRVAAAARARGIAPGFALTIPADPAAAIIADVYPARPEDQRVIYFDRQSGALIKDVGYRDYGWGARAVETGVQLHMGRYFGRANQYLMLLACLAVIALAASGIAMWARRGGARRWAPPPPLSFRGMGRGVAAILILLACILPAFGASLIAVLVTERLAARRRLSAPEPSCR
jgi:uncharacterized iron-regulated membrane protein